MKNVVRFVFSIVVLSSLAVSQLPETGNCQMALGAFFAASCPMPCCKTTRSMPNCPLLKTVTPQDFIATTAPVLKTALAPLHAVKMALLPPTRQWSTIVPDLAGILELIFAGPSQAVRAPPSDVHLQAA
jgi:hypothetical protein